MKRKLLLPLGVIAATVAPVATAVSCSKDDIVPNSKKFYVADDAVVLDVSTMSASELVNKILGTIGTRMSKPITEMTPDNEEAYAIVREYLSKANFYKNIIRLSNGDEHYDLDFTDVHKHMDELSHIANNIKFNGLDNSQTLSIGIEADGVQPIEYTKVILESGEATNLSGWLKMYVATPPTKQTVIVTQKDIDAANGYLSLPTGGYAKVGDTYEKETYEDVKSIVARHPYINLLKSYHKIFNDFVHSPFYAKWSVGKSFIVAENKSPFVIAGTHQSAGTQVIAKAGELYDLPNSLALDARGKTLPETSNLEFQFFYNLLDLN